MLKNHAMENVKPTLEELQLENDNLIKQLDRFKTLIDSTVDWEILMLPSGEFSYCSPSCKSISGYDATEFTSNSELFFEIIHPMDKELVKQHLNKKKHNEETDDDLEFRIITKDGQEKWIGHFCQKAFDSAGNFIGYRSSNRDISKRKEIEIELKQTNQSLHNERQIFTQGNAVIFKWKNSENWLVEYVSPNIESIFGFTPDEMQSPQFIYSNFIFPDDLERIASEVERFSKPKINSFEHEPYRVVAKNGKIHWVLDYTIIIRNDNGEIINYLGYLVDITVQKVAEETLRENEEKYYELYTLLRMMSDTMPDMLWAKDLNGRYIFTNKSICKNMLNARDTSEPIGKTDVFFAQRERDLHPENLQYHTFGELCCDSDKVTLQKMKEMQFDEYGNIKGKFLYLDVYKAPLIDNNGKLIGVVGSARDITEKRKTLDDLVIAKERAEESDRLKSAFLANMSHEIRTPMNGILGFAGLLKEPKLSCEQQQKYIQIIEKSGARMLNIINDIVSISKIESGIVDINLSETNINNQLQFVYDSLILDAGNKNLKLSFNCALTEKEAMIKTDSEKYYGIISNLVKNAVKYTDKGTIEFGYVSKGEEFEFYVKDTGIGIPKERQKAIFERFIQADIIDKMARQGAGLGLAISRAYVDMLGGKIWVESEEAKGSTFFFTLPCNLDSKEKINISTAFMDESEAKPITPKISGLKVLIAEDDEASEMLISIELENFSKEILKVTTGLAAIEICRKNPDIDLVLMDIQMPGMNGYEATRKIREFNKDVIIIAQTAFALTGDREKAIESGCNNYISKPIKQTELMELIQTYFKK
jgi:hypothetical protein